MSRPVVVFLDVHAPEDLCVPGYEYHYIDEWAEPPSLYSQIPEGFAGAASEVDPSRADASPWIDAMPVIRAYRRAYASDFSSRRSTAR